MNYTSYFARMKRVENIAIPVCITRHVPNEYMWCIRYEKLAPTDKMLDQFENTNNEALFTKQYTEEILDKLDAREIIAELRAIGKKKNFCLISHEAPGEFSHRHIAANWLRNAGLNIHEL